jgi:hypothetical protein
MRAYCPNEKCIDIVETGIAGVYNTDIKDCPRCGTTLAAIEEPAGDEPGPDTEGPHMEYVPMETICFVTNRGALPVMRSLLQAEGIRYVVRNELDELSSLYGAVSSSLGLRSGAPAIAVQKDRADEARALLTTKAEPIQE